MVTQLVEAVKKHKEALADEAYAIFKQCLADVLFSVILYHQSNCILARKHCSAFEPMGALAIKIPESALTINIYTRHIMEAVHLGSISDTFISIPLEDDFVISINLEDSI